MSDRAVLVDGVVQHLGSPFAEQRDLATGEAIAVLDDRAVITVSGEDRLSWLDSISSQALGGLAAGASTETLILDPQGHVEHAAAVVDDGVTTWLIADRDDAAALAAWLTRMRFRLRVDPRAAADCAVVGGGNAAVTAAANRWGIEMPVWRDPWPEVGSGSVGYAPAEGHPGVDRDWSEIIVPRHLRDELVHGAVGEFHAAGAAAADALRVAAWRPRWAAEVDERTLPHEVDWLRTAVHLAKGCYRGQETVAKVHNLGHPPRRLVALHLDGSDERLPRRGDAVRSGDAVVGRVTSAARHYEQGPIGLALVKRTAPVDGDLVVDTDDGPVAASAAVIVPPDAGAVAAVPRMRRLPAHG